jgi:transcriptional regulator with XRE-family HTH domain
VDPLPNLTSVPERFRFLREQAGLSRRALSEALESRGLKSCSAAQIRRYESESDDASPSVEIARALAEIAEAPAAWLVSGDPSSSDGVLTDVPPDALQILGHLEGELMRQEEDGEEGGAQVAFTRVERRVRALRAEGRLSDAGYLYWRALRRGAVLAGGYEPDDPEAEDPAAADGSHPNIAGSQR